MCSTCQETFVSNSDLAQHLAASHGGASVATGEGEGEGAYTVSQLDKPFQCCSPGCGLFFKTLTGNPTRVLMCRKCVKSCYLEKLPLSSLHHDGGDPSISQILIRVNEKDDVLTSAVPT